MDIATYAVLDIHTNETIIVRRNHGSQVVRSATLAVAPPYTDISFWRYPRYHARSGMHRESKP